MRTPLLLLAALSATACVSTRDRHGYVIERGETELEAMAGVDTRESVLARFGEPSFRPALYDDVWYYASAATNTRAFYQTETMSRQVVAFHFDDDGTVTNVENYTLADGQNINMVDRVTRTRGKELTFLEQLIGGVGQMPGAVDPDAGSGP
ncbi:outer membrane protein assembly factor BamE [Parvularcula sp. LCG005]|uniref:outer membrane protein assembly factor BamE n=1 Tax=Parvularcula sp. LCG005 TaxID=3078805 RepID=UPI0029428A6F|nr:outer membrane protein assembly factor BamE [Parvularcula sp. LCG005]WOI54230.1 outer membrane protein assembly factor BamE [Parvularcula sp. LCG005]